MTDEAEQEFDDEVEPVGWDAINAVLDPIYGDQDPMHYGTAIPYQLGGKDPLTGISVYKNLEPQPHYHFVTYGFSELYDKETEDPEISGYGFELTFRLGCGADAPAEPPNWPLNFLQNLARYVFSTGNAFDERHHMTLNGPIALAEETDITAIMLMLDPQMNEIDTPNGHVKFLQIVGLCTDEHHLVEEGYFDPVAQRVAAVAPLAITNICRDSILKDPKALEEIMAAPPSTSQNEVFGTLAEWEETDDSLRIQVGATVVRQLKGMLTGCVAQGEPGVVYGKGSGIVFQPGDTAKWEEEDGLLIVTLPAEAVANLAESLEPQRGEYPLPNIKQIVLEVMPVDIKDTHGNVMKTVGQSWPSRNKVPV